VTGKPEAKVNASGPLDGIRVIDVTTARSGPTCTRQLADMGAEVIHVVRPGGVDLGGSDGWNLHRNKRSIALDLKTPGALDVILTLIETADVFVENWRPDVKHRLGVSPATLCERNRRLIYGSISGFGQTGPYANRPGLDQIIQGMGGLMSVTGPTGTRPWRAGIAISDLAAGTFLAQGIVAALFARERTGRGQWVHTSLLESMVNLLDFQATRWLIDRQRPAQEGNNHPTFSPMGMFATSDGYINIAVIHGFERFCDLIGAPHLASDPRFGGFVERTEHRGALDAALAEIFQARRSSDWVELLAEEFPCGPVLDVPGVFEDSQVRHLGMTERVEHPERGPIDVLRSPLSFSETPQAIRSGPPLPGSDTEAVLNELASAPRFRS
jgi:crotonobetainyl-CoA:carnitine CoA-transferase CaiB-like acyl-CoA transferase